MPCFAKPFGQLVIIITKKGSLPTNITNHEKKKKCNSEKFYARLARESQYFRLHLPSASRSDL